MKAGHTPSRRADRNAGEDENGTIDRLGGQIAFERLVAKECSAKDREGAQVHAHRDSVHIGIINEPDDLVREQLRVVLAVQVRLRRLG